jgi:hypothetical protein
METRPSYLFVMLALCSCAVGSTDVGEDVVVPDKGGAPPAVTVGPHEVEKKTSDKCSPVFDEHMDIVAWQCPLGTDVIKMGDDFGEDMGEDLGHGGAPIPKPDPGPDPT